MKKMTIKDKLEAMKQPMGQVNLAWKGTQEELDIRNKGYNKAIDDVISIME